MTNATNGTVNRTEAEPLSALELDVLKACHELTLRQQELLPLLAAALHVSEHQVFYTWAFRRCRQRGQLEGTPWEYFFHGMECDVKNTADGRYLRIDFGPGGRVDTFTLWGVLQFVMTSVAPWPEFPQLKRQFARGDPPFNQFSGDMRKIAPVWDSLEARGVFARAAPDLVAFQAKYTTLTPEGLQYTRYPAGTSEETMADCSVAHRTILSPYGRSIVEEQLVKQNGA